MTSSINLGRPVEILLVEDNPGDVELARVGLEEGKIESNLHVVGDGTEALSFLRQEPRYAAVPRPDLILLDLNLPRMNGRQLLSVIKEDDALKAIPVVVLTSSSAEEDVSQCYQLHANCYVTKPIRLEQFLVVLERINEFWFRIVQLPTEALHDE